MYEPVGDRYGHQVVLTSWLLSAKGHHDVCVWHDSLMIGSRKGKPRWPRER